MNYSAISTILQIVIVPIVLAACGSTPSSPLNHPPAPHQSLLLHDNETQWRDSISVNRHQNRFSAQELVNYINGYFPLHQLTTGTYLYRCVNPGQQNNIEFPSFFARTEAFQAFHHQPGPWNPSGLCTTRTLYRYRVRQNLHLTNLLTQRRYELPNGALINSLASVLAFHHPLHRTTLNGQPQYKAHILDNTIDASLRDEPIITQQILNRLHPQAIGRVAYFCHRILNDSISSAYNRHRHLNGWMDYDPAFNPPDHHEIPHLTEHDRQQKEEILLCNPEQYLEPNPELIREDLL